MGLAGKTGDPEQHQYMPDGPSNAPRISRGEFQGADISSCSHRGRHMVYSATCSSLEKQATPRLIKHQPFVGWIHRRSPRVNPEKQTALTLSAEWKQCSSLTWIQCRQEAGAKLWAMR